MRAIISIVVFALAGSIALGQCPDISINAVGCIKLVAEKGKFTLGRSDFESMNRSGGLTVSDMLGEQLPVGSQLYLWDRSAKMFRIAVKPLGAGWGSAGITRVARGEGFWIRVPESAASNRYPVFIMGMVPSCKTAPTTTMSGVNMLGLPYPVQMKWTNTDIAKTAPVNSTVYLWNQSNQTYSAYVKSAGAGWDGAAADVILYPGQGFWLRNTGTFEWAEAKPYRWP